MVLNVRALFRFEWSEWFRRFEWPGRFKRSGKFERFERIQRIEWFGGFSGFNALRGQGGSSGLGGVRRGVGLGGLGGLGGPTWLSGIGSSYLVEWREGDQKTRVSRELSGTISVNNISASTYDRICILRRAARRKTQIRLGHPKKNPKILDFLSGRIVQTHFFGISFFRGAQ